MKFVRSLSALSFLVLSLLVGCGEGDPLSSKDPHELASLWREADGATQARYFSRLDSSRWLPGILAELSHLSGLPVLRDVPMTVVPAASSREFLAALDAETLGEETRAYAALEAGLAAVGESLGLEGGMTAIVSEPDADEEAANAVGLLGLYVPKKQQFFLIDGFDEAVQLYTIRHELMHALQDQSFGLDTYLEAALPDFDRVLARKALVEGQAETVARLATWWRHDAKVAEAVNPFNVFSAPQALARFALPPGLARPALAARGWARSVLRPGASGGLAGPTFAKAGVQGPSFVLFQYEEGAHFVTATAAHASRASLQAWVQQTLQDPPLTTQELLHPNVYIDRLSASPNQVAQRPLDHASLAAVATEGTSPIWHSRLGEMAMRVYNFDQKALWLASHLEADHAYVVQQPGSDVPVTLWLTRWNTVAHAATFSTIAERRQAKALERHKDAAIRYTIRVKHVGNLVAVATDVVQAGELDEDGRAFEARVERGLAAALADNG